MELRSLLPALIGLASIIPAAADASQLAGRSRLAEIVAHLESRYPAEVIAIELDEGGDKPAHYHVDMKFPSSGLARLDIDAATIEMAARTSPSLTPGSASLAEATSLATQALPGEMIRAELDWIDATSPHYDIDVRLSTGSVARLKIDAATRAFAWRTPPVAHD